VKRGRRELPDAAGEQAARGGGAQPPLHGLVVLDKPSGLTSFEAMRIAARRLGVRRVGHGGTLDPLATGVLPICVGEATKLAPFLLAGDKEYEAELLLGVETDSHDADGVVTAEHDASGVDAQAVAAAAAHLVGTQKQKPPMYSAVRVAGRRLYELARAGLEVERRAREIAVSAFDVLDFANAGSARPVVRARIACSKGTYVRVLCADLGTALGVGAHLTALRRTRSGPFGIADALPLDAIDRQRVLPPAAALPEWPLVRVKGALVTRVRDGQRLTGAELEVTLRPGTRLRLATERGDLLALAEAAEDDVIRVLRVFNYGLTEPTSSAILTDN
jgi:tRNA pseudouridine55 synthase